ncbi:MAG: electron transfer flavoprotein subunit alpha/FixB family protein, partial [Alphaproteobacteria bacterium]|nr:electron transfer flavoprotein subunit alpha/FixB family protein [Alphaproteobacteria bacterium]
MTVLVLAEHDKDGLKPATAITVAAAVEIAGHAGGDVEVLVAGHDCSAAAEAAALLDGVAKVRLADDRLLEHDLAETVAGLIISLMDE